MGLGCSGGEACPPVLLRTPPCPWGRHAEPSPELGPQGGAETRAPGSLCSCGWWLWHVHPRTRNGPKCPGCPAPQRFLWPPPATHLGSPRPSGSPKPGTGASAVAHPHLLILCSSVTRSGAPHLPQYLPDSPKMDTRRQGVCPPCTDSSPQGPAHGGAGELPREHTLF